MTEGNIIKSRAMWFTRMCGDIPQARTKAGRLDSVNPVIKNRAWATNSDSQARATGSLVQAGLTLSFPRLAWPVLTKR
ncbi:hypothetical protein AMTR_s00030p00120640 [Amborella trichopoda]|uniref:Uncharacterized protein n=1 Tax=Amborella trichopoda TaxID=13333 RepID=U5D0W7_AMBTC|nr:hypothetical protein AMTR_s00030p00120640 [Amborella trichopoda]